MEKELTAIAAATPSTLGGGNHGHAGIIVENAKYTMMMGGVAFVNPVNPGLIQQLQQMLQLEPGPERKRSIKDSSESMKSSME
jgi:hypothetical protein